MSDVVPSSFGPAIRTARGYDELPWPRTADGKVDLVRVFRAVVDSSVLASVAGDAHREACELAVARARLHDRMGGMCEAPGCSGMTLRDQARACKHDKHQTTEEINQQWTLSDQTLADTTMLTYFPYGMRHCNVAGVPTVSILSDDAMIDFLAVTRLAKAHGLFDDDDDDDHENGDADARRDIFFGGLRSATVYLAHEPTFFPRAAARKLSREDMQVLRRSVARAEYIVAAATGLPAQELVTRTVTVVGGESDDHTAVRQVLHTDLERRRCVGDSSSREFLRHPLRGARGTLFSVLVTLVGESANYTTGHPDVLAYLHRGFTDLGQLAYKPERDALWDAPSGRGGNSMRSLLDTPWSVEQGSVIRAAPAPGQAHVFTSYNTEHAGNGCSGLRYALYLEVEIKGGHAGPSLPNEQQNMPWVESARLFPATTDDDGHERPSEAFRIIRGLHTAWVYIDRHDELLARLPEDKRDKAGALKAAYEDVYKTYPHGDSTAFNAFVKDFRQIWTTLVDRHPWHTEWTKQGDAHRTKWFHKPKFKPMNNLILAVEQLVGNRDTRQHLTMYYRKYIQDALASRNAPLGLARRADSGPSGPRKRKAE